MKLKLEVVGFTETQANASTFPSTTIDLTTNIFVFHDGAITVGATSTLMKTWEITVDNHIDRERFFNSVTLAGTLALDRTITFKTQIAYDTALGALIYGTGISGAHIVLNHTNGGSKLNIDLPAVSFPKEGIAIEGSTELMLNINGTAFRTGAAPEMTVLSNVGP